MLEAVMEALTSLPHRGSTTAQERLAARRLAALLEERGFAVERQPFLSPRSYGWELLAISLLLALGGLSVQSWLALLGTAGFGIYFSGVRPPWSRLSDRLPSQNLITDVGNGPRRLLLMAHYDTAKSFFLYHPRRVRSFRANFLLNTLLAALTPVAVLVWTPAGRLLGTYFLVQAGLLLWREAREPWVNGANDNASGVAVATELFARLAPEVPEDWTLGLALTGCEEVGFRGARALLDSGRIPPDALVLNVDNVGRGDLHYATGEGMLGFTPFRGPLQECARQLDTAAPLAYRLAYFDTLPFARAGYACLTLIRLEDGLPPHWHWPSDTAGNLEPAALEDTVRYGETLIRAVWSGEGTRS